MEGVAFSPHTAAVVGCFPSLYRRAAPLSTTSQKSSEAETRSAGKRGEATEKTSPPEEARAMAGRWAGEEEWRGRGQGVVGWWKLRSSTHPPRSLAASPLTQPLPPFSSAFPSTRLLFLPFLAITRPRLLSTLLKCRFCGIVRSSSLSSGAAASSAAALRSTSGDSSSAPLLCPAPACSDHLRCRRPAVGTSQYLASPLSPALILHRRTDVTSSAPTPTHSQHPTPSPLF